MSYSVYLFRKEVKEQNSDLDFWENENLVIPFLDEQFDNLRARLLKYDYQIQDTNGDIISFNYKGGQNNITVILSKKQLTLSSGFSEMAFLRFHKLHLNLRIAANLPNLTLKMDNGRNSKSLLSGKLEIVLV
jgi:hypothetical protein